MKLYHYMDEHFGLKNLAKRRIKASTFDRLNDPFELLGIETSDQEIRAALKKMKQRVASKFGILCFSKIWSNPVQWAHYADNHQGLCIELELADKDDARKVDYVSERLESKLITDPEFSQKLLLSKFKHWEYEQEYRLIRELINFDKDSGIFFQPFNSDIKLTKIIIGCQSNITRNSLMEKLNEADLDVEIIYARAAFKSFKIVKHRNK